MIDILNDNQGVIAIVTIIITIVGFFITNKNINQIYQKSKSGNNSKTIQIWNLNNKKDD